MRTATARRRLPGEDRTTTSRAGAGASTVLGNFDDASFTYGDVDALLAPWRLS
jgi:hypothetical protein